VENDTGLDLDGFFLNVHLYDKDNVLVETAYVSDVSNFKAGMKAKFTFSTSADFVRYELEYSRF
jgi:hypothetical protein